MASIAPFAVGSGVNVVNYHQEFDLEDHFRYEPPTFHNVVHSYVHYMKETHVMDAVASSPLLPGWVWRRYGAGMEQSIQHAKGVGEAMRDSGWTWHYKPEGDGYGHCYSQDTEILTSSGWKLFCDLSPGDLVVTLTQGTGALEYQQPTGYQKYYYEGDMCHFEGRTVDLLVTPGHRMWVERYDKNAKSLGWRFEIAKSTNCVESH